MLKQLIYFNTVEIRDDKKDPEIPPLQEVMDNLDHLKKDYDIHKKYHRVLLKKKDLENYLLRVLDYNKNIKERQ